MQGNNTTEPKRIRVPLEIAATWECECGFRVGISDEAECGKIMMAVSSGQGAEKPCPKCGTICEIYEKPPARKLEVVRGQLPPGARNRAERRATAAQARAQLGGLVDPLGRPLK